MAIQPMTIPAIAPPESEDPLLLLAESLPSCGKVLLAVLKELLVEEVAVDNVAVVKEAVVNNALLL